MLNIKIYFCNPFQENTYILWDDTQEGVIVDPGCYDENELETVTGFIEKKGIQIKAIWLTHGHFDHIYGVTALARKYGVEIYGSHKDQIILEHMAEQTRRFGIKNPDTDFTTIDLQDRDQIGFGQTEFQVITTPGHTPGGVCFYCQKEKVLMSGDTLFAGAIGRSDLYMGEYDDLIVSLMDKIMGLDGDVTVWPGHGPKTDIGHERTHNPFLQPFNEKEEDMDWDEDGLEIHG